MPGGGCAELPRRGEAVARLPPSCVCVCACARSIRRGAKKILLLLFFIKSVPFCVSFSVSLCVSLAVSLMAFEPFIYRPCGVSLAVSLPVPCNVSRSVSQFGSQFGVDAMSPRHISHPSLGNGWVTCAGSIPRPMCHDKRRRAASAAVPLWPAAAVRFGAKMCWRSSGYGQRRRAAVSSGRHFNMANGVGRRQAVRGGSAVPLWPTASGRF